MSIICVQCGAKLAPGAPFGLSICSACHFSNWRAEAKPRVPALGNTAASWRVDGQVDPQAVHFRLTDVSAIFPLKNMNFYRDDGWINLPVFTVELVGGTKITCCWEQSEGLLRPQKPLATGATEVPHQPESSPTRAATKLFHDKLLSRWQWLLDAPKRPDA